MYLPNYDNWKLACPYDNENDQEEEVEDVSAPYSNTLLSWNTDNLLHYFYVDVVNSDDGEVPF